MVLHAQIQNVTNTAVAVDADASRFPSTWLFSARWNKGKKVQNEFTLVSDLSPRPKHGRRTLIVSGS